MGEGGNARTVFWIMLLLAWPFALWQAYCIISGRPVPFGQYKSGLAYVEVMRDGAFIPAAVQHCWQMLGLEAVVFAMITLIAYMHSYYPGRRY